MRMESDLWFSLLKRWKSCFQGWIYNFQPYFSFIQLCFLFENKFSLLGLSIQPVFLFIQLSCLFEKTFSMLELRFLRMELFLQKMDLQFSWLRTKKQKIENFAERCVWDGNQIFIFEFAGGKDGFSSFMDGFQFFILLDRWFNFENAWERGFWWWEVGFCWVWK